jgi:hypothetical protein
VALYRQLVAMVAMVAMVTDNPEYVGFLADAEQLAATLAPSTG